MVNNNQINNGSQANAKEIVRWEEKYATGIELIDSQHKEIVALTNELFQACLSGDEVAGAAFKDAMHRMVEYVNFHFTAELELLKRINYPTYLEHKKQHDELVQQILEAAKGFKEGKRFVPNVFVRSLRDWIFGHIAVSDRRYAEFVADQKKKGLLSDQQING